MSDSFSRYRPHPWHGLSTGDRAPRVVQAYIEMTPFDGIKYEIDKHSGYLKVDRPQLFSSMPPTLYGFIPQTYCGPKVAKLAKGAKKGDGDPMDICVFSERPITRVEIILPARVIGGIRMIDKGEADDKIIAVLDNDPYCAGVNDIKDLHPHLLNRLQHYFLTYKQIPGQTKGAPVQIADVYGVKAAHQAIQAAMDDYSTEFQ